MDGNDTRREAGNDVPREDGGESQGWFERRRQRRRADAERKQAERRERQQAAEDEQYREDLERQRSDTEAGKSPDARMRRALKQVRREGYKVALIYAAVDAALAVLVVNILLQVLRPQEIPTTLPWPRALFDAIVGYTGAPPAPLQTSIVAGLAAGVLVFLAEFVARTRRPFVEQFEGANPGVREALRTARDTVESGRDSRMALALYEDVLARLRRTSSIGLVNLKRVFLTVVIVTAISLASIQVAVVDLNVRDLGPEDDAGGDDQSSEYEGLQDASGVLGEPEDVTAGEETLNTTLSTQGGGDDGSDSAPAAYDSSGFAGSGDVEGQEAGFAESEQLEDAELIREYNLRIRETDDSDSDT
ncbi:hypothetical protein C2R22_08020 [Salinigranum rubrum]|uniref:Uncharacterized protein n=1 Tax=Salinigranum rubrum TaxID=755307 RepID=A0A2I8VI67_9EURY|nr:hypothetical protein [Salinigranum rubrum]AUV81605.1 hypothetical protein C2R22_08020 [Salinigranum rubrum]